MKLSIYLIHKAQMNDSKNMEPATRDVIISEYIFIAKSGACSYKWKHPKKKKSERLYIRPNLIMTSQTLTSLWNVMEKHHRSLSF